MLKPFLCFLGVLVSGACLDAWANSDEFPEALAKAAHMSSLVEPGSQPFHLKLVALNIATLTIVGKKTNGLSGVEALAVLLLMGGQ